MIDFEKFLEQAKEKINSCGSVNSLLHEIKADIFGKNSELTKALGEMKNLAIEEKKNFGKKINELKEQLENALNQKRVELEAKILEQKMMLEGLDGTLPYRQQKQGSLHILTKTTTELCEIFKKYGFELASGFEIEEDFYNFTALNVVKNHPARQMQDTFYIRGKNDKNENYLLRTHTTCVDARNVIEGNRKPPIFLIAQGATFRVDSDRTHSPMFHQFEGLMIDKNLNMGHLKTLLEKAMKDFFETDNIHLRLRPSYFPFTEPSMEVDVGYDVVDGEIQIGGNKKWLEVLGCGMLHPNVLKHMNIDSEQYTAIAFGLGIERFAMLKYHANDIREFTVSNTQWLNRYSVRHEKI